LTASFEGKQMEKRLFSIKEISIYLILSSQTIRNKLSAGSFPNSSHKDGGNTPLGQKESGQVLG